MVEASQELHRERFIGLIRDNGLDKRRVVNKIRERILGAGELLLALDRSKLCFRMSRIGMVLHGRS
jgi:hypothetical protein